MALLCLPGPVMRPFTALGLCRSVSQNSFPQQINCKTSSEAMKRDKASAWVPRAQTASPAICGNTFARGTRTRGITPKQPYPFSDRRSKAAVTFHVPEAKEPLPLLVGSSPRLFSKKLMKVCSPASPRPLQRFHTACSQTLARPEVNADLH